VERELEQLRDQIAAIQDRIAADREQRDTEMEALADIERELGQLSRQLRQTREDLDDNRDRLEEKQAREQELEAALSAEEQELSAQLRSAHRMGRRSRLRLLLNQDEPQRFARILAYHSYLTRSRVESIERVSENLRSLSAVQRDIEERQQELERLEASQARDLERQEAAQVERAEAVEKLEKRITERRSELEDLEISAAELEHLLEELATVLADIPPEMESPPFAELRGQLDMPVDGRVAASFGDRRGGDLDWNGWLIRASAGEDVKAVGHGRVVFSDWLRGYGLVLIIDHGDDFLSLYAHNDSLLNDVGDWVRTGQSIATVGNSGGEEQAGLYFELRRGGRPVDPANWLRR